MSTTIHVTPHPPPPTTIKNKPLSAHKVGGGTSIVGDSAATTTSNTLQEEVFEKMMTRMMNSVGIPSVGGPGGAQRNKPHNNAKFSSPSSAVRARAGKVSSSDYVNTGAKTSSSTRRGLMLNTNDLAPSPSATTAATTAIEELPALISSLRGALSPRANQSSSSLGATGSLLDEAQKNQLYRSLNKNNDSNRRSGSRNNSPLDRLSSATTMGQSKMYLQYEKQREQEQRIEEARSAMSMNINNNNAIGNDNNNYASSDVRQQHQQQGNIVKAVTANIRNAVAVNNNNNNNASNGQVPSSENTSNNNNNNNVTTAVQEIENRIFGGGPVPASLRSVVNEARDSIALRLKLSDVGTFRNCAQALFECRSLIDQVLKQMPNHWHFRDESFGMTSEEENVALHHYSQQQQKQKQKHLQRKQSSSSIIIQQAAQQKLLGDMMDECRKAALNVQIPQGTYFLNEETGTVGVGVTSKISLGEIQQQTNQTGFTKNSQTIPQQVRGGGAPPGTDSIIISSSSSTQQQRQQKLTTTSSNNNNTNNTESSNHNNKHVNFVNGYFSPIPPYADFAGRSLKDQATVNSHNNNIRFLDDGAGAQRSQTNQQQQPGTLANVLQLLDAESDHQRLLRFLRRQTQQTTSCTQTDEKMKDELSKEDFAFQQRKVRELEVLAKEYEGTVQRLRNQLRIAQGALATRSGTVTYIRETLLKESSILKTQLQVLQQYHLSHQQQQQQQQQTQQQQQQQQQSDGTSTNNNNNNNFMFINSPSRAMNIQNNFSANNNIYQNNKSFYYYNSSGPANLQQQNSNPSPSSIQALPSFTRPAYHQSDYTSTINNATTTTITSTSGGYQNHPQVNASNIYNISNFNNNDCSSTWNPTSPITSGGTTTALPFQPHRAPPLSTLSLQPLAPIYSLLDTILCAVENEEVLEKVGSGGSTGRGDSPSSSSSPLNDHDHQLVDNLHRHSSSSSSHHRSQQQHQLFSNNNNNNNNNIPNDASNSFVTGPSKEAQLRELKGLFAQQQAHWKRETADARSRFALAMKRKNEQLKKVTLASNVVYLRETLLKMFGNFKDAFADFKASVKSAMKVHASFVQRTARDLEAGISRASSDLENHHQLVKEREALREVIFAVPDLIVPSLAPEFAMGYHSWSYAESNDPLRSYANAHYGSELVDRMSDELGVLHDLFVEVQRFGVRVHQLPDVHRPKPGWLLSRVAQGLLRSPSCTNELATQIRSHLERDDALAKQQAKVNIAIHGVIIRRKVLADRIRLALREGEVPGYETLSDEATLADLTNSSPWDRSNKVSNSKRIAAINATFSDIPTCASRFNQFAEDIDTCHIKRMKLQHQRMENARQLFQLWRNAGIDVTGGRYAIVSRDPDSPWSSGLVKTRRLKAALAVVVGAGGGGGSGGDRRQQQQQQLQLQQNGFERSETNNFVAASLSPIVAVASVSGRYGSAGVSLNANDRSAARNRVVSVVSELN